MSYVSNVILTFSIGEDVLDRIEDINQSLTDYNQAFLPEVWERRGDWYGGSKALEQPVFIAAFDHVSADDILGAVRATKWREPENVRVFFCGQPDDAFEQIWPEDHDKISEWHVMTMAAKTARRKREESE